MKLIRKDAQKHVANAPYVTADPQNHTEKGLEAVTREPASKDAYVTIGALVPDMSPDMSPCKTAQDKGLNGGGDKSDKSDKKKPTLSKNGDGVPELKDCDREVIEL